MSSYHHEWLPPAIPALVELPKTEAPYFAVSVTKLVIMDVVTFGVYGFYWQYKQWTKIKQQTQSNLSPFWRAFFSIFLIHQFFKHVRTHTEEEGLPKTLPVGVLTLIYVIGTLISRLAEGLLFLVSLIATTLSVALIQQELDQLHTKLAPDADRNARFTPWNIIFGQIGLILWALYFIGELFPDFAFGHEDFE